MHIIKVPATSANVGPGFDSLGIAFALYATFQVEASIQDILENVDPAFNNPGNLFLQAYHVGMQEIGIEDGVHMILHSDVPISRGLGSSATLIVGGLLAASVLHDNALTKQRIFELATQMEGHPDNVAPALFGGFTACMEEEGQFYMRQLPLQDDFVWTVCIPDFEVSTEEARSILPSHYDRKTAASNGAHAMLLCEAFRTGDLELAKLASHDEIHEPYRSTLIPHFQQIKKMITLDTDGFFVISGSGSTCLSVSKRSLSQSVQEQINQLTHAHWQMKEVAIAWKGSEVYEQ